MCRRFRGLRALGVAILLLCVVVGIKACVRDDAQLRIVDEACKIARTDSEEALRLIRSVDRGALRSDEALARYALAYSEVCYYVGIDSDNDSLTRIAINYYDDRKEYEERVRAFYYHGLVKHTANQLPEAMLAYMEAESSLSEVDNPYLEGIVHRAKGDIYGEGCLYNNAYEEYMKSLDCFERAGLEEHIAYARYDLGRFALAQRKYEEAEEHLMAAYDYAIAVADMSFLQIVIYDLSELYVQQGEYERCAEVLDMHKSSGYEIYDLSHHNSLMAVMEAVEGNEAKAYEYIALAEESEPRNELLISYAKYCVNRVFCDYKEALTWLEWSNQRQDSTILSALEQPVLNYQIGMLQSTIESKEREAALIHQRNIAIYAIITCVVLALILFVYLRFQKKNRDIQYYMETINELQLTRNDGDKQLAEAVDHLYNDRLVDLNRLCETYYDHNDTARHATKVFEQVRQTIESIKSDEGRIAELEELVDNCRGGLMSKLRSQCPKLNERELRVALYSYAGFSSRAICIFVESNPVALSKIKYRIKTKIKECGGPDAEMLLSAMVDH